jgi:hypothetical protein
MLMLMKRSQRLARGGPVRTTAAAVFSSFFALVAPAFAQTQITTGVIQGSVIDATGAALPGVTVEVRNTETNLSRVLATGNDGRFVFLQLPSGTYTVTYTLPGFATLVQENVLLTVGQAVTLSGQMTVSTLAETVRVTAEAAVVETTRSAVARICSRSPLASAWCRDRTATKSPLPASVECSTTSASTAATSTTASSVNRSAVSVPRSTSRSKPSRSSR